jgi:glycosyltransferase involved in cell wall biosynthesis
MPGKGKRSKICIITTIDISLDKLFPDFYPLLIERGYDVIGISAKGPYSEKLRKFGIKVINVPMTRSFTVLQDLKCIWQLYRIFRRERFEIVHYSTPKASFLASIAGRLARCNVLLYTLRGLGYNAFRGPRKFIAKFCEKIACRSAHYVISISESLKDKAVSENLLPAKRVFVLGAGSSKGVNLNKFKIDEDISQQRKAIRQLLGVVKNTIVIGYAGRLSNEKGIDELVEAFSKIYEKNRKTFLVLVGNQDERNPLPDLNVAKIEKHPGIKIIPFQEEISHYIFAMDILALPSYREGFGNVLIEASALEKPVVATDITGCRDAVIDNVTGFLVEPKNPISLRNALTQLINDSSKRREMGRNGGSWVRENFDRDLVWKRMIDVYEMMLDGN